MLARALSYALVSGSDGRPFDLFLCHEVVVTFVNIVLTQAPPLFAAVIAGNLAPSRGWRRSAVISSAILAATAFGLTLRLTLTAGGAEILRGNDLWNFVLAVGLRTTLLAGMLTLALEAQRRALASIEAARQSALGSEVLDRELAESRLQALQAQIEPHFLFNTLANVRRLCDTDLDRGLQLLDSLMRYLRIALPRLRAAQVPLGSEAELVDAYLRIHQIRMGTRLRFQIDIADALRRHPVPPLMLLTLVENAVKHGIAPSRQGGDIRIAATATDTFLELTVADTGVGFAPGSGTGTGLANTRARLTAQFGAAAQLALGRNDFGGTTATIRLPLSPGLPP